MRFSNRRFVALAGSALAASAYVSPHAAAQDASRIDVELSNDEQTWTSQLAFLPGNTIYVRVRVSHIGTQTVLGLANVTFQPTISPWSPDSVLLPFTNPTTGTGVPDLPGLRGRIIPFDTPGMGSTSRSGVLTGFIDSGPTLRIAGSNSAGISDIGRGVACGQLPIAISTNFVTSTSVVVFKSAVQLGSQAPVGDYAFDVPITGISQSRVVWYITPVGASSHIDALTSADIHPAHAYLGGNPCIFAPIFTSQPTPAARSSGQTAAFDAAVNLGICQPTSMRWYQGNMPLADGERIAGSASAHLRISDVALSDAGTYRLLATNTLGSTWSNPATLTVRCTTDMDDGTGTGIPDGGVTVDDLLFFGTTFELGGSRADIDDGTHTGTPDGGVTIDDLLYFLQRFEAGC